MIPKITLIVPVYNVEKWLPQCMDSLVGQTLKDIEILCINDGSTDHSLDVLESYAAKDQRIRVISQQNAGQGAARNRGIREAKGAYVGFVVRMIGWMFIFVKKCMKPLSKMMPSW